MDECQNSKLNDLQQRLQEAEKNAILAATYGKQLLEENHDLHTKLEDTFKESTTKIEELQQQNHCISLKLEAKIAIERSLSQELEHLRAQHKQELSSQARSHGQEILKHTKKVSEMEAAAESQQMKLNQMEEHIVLLKTQLKDVQEKLEMCNFSIHEQSVDETTASMQSQIMTLSCEKQELEVQMSSMKAEMKTGKHKLAKAEDAITRLKAELEEKECQCTSYYNALEQNKTDMQELRMEIDSLRLAETDPARKGNSLFAEVEDHRQAMEKQLLSYKTNYTIAKKQNELKSQQINKMKLQLASLLSLSSVKSDGDYLTRLEESLASARTQLEKFAKRCQELESQQDTTSSSQIYIGKDGEDRNSLFQGLYSESQTKIAEIGQKLRTAEFDKVVLSDRVLQLQRKLRQAEVNHDASRAEAIRLRVRLEEMASKKGEKMYPSIKEQKVYVEKIPDFEKLVSHTTKSQVIVPEEIVPLKEKLLDPNTMKEVDKPVEKLSISSTSVGNGVDNSKSPTAENQENVLSCAVELQKKRKKCVRMTETASIQDCDGEVQETKLKFEEGKKVEKKPKVLRKMEAPVIRIPKSGPSEECKQQ
nr:protein Spindly-like isoform X2 [Procambarus clarkii]